MNETDLAANTDFQGSHGDPAPALRILAEAGFRYLHWCHEWNSDHLYSDREIAEIAGVLKETGLRLLDIHGSDGAAHGFISCWYAENETFRKAGVELVLNRLRMHAMLRGEGTLMMHIPFLRRQASPGQRALVRRQTDALRRSLDELAPIAQNLGIPLALENMPGDTWEVLDELLAAYPPDAVGICYDSGHGHIAMDGEQATGLDCLEQRIDRLLALHLHDNDGCGDQHQPPFYGTLDWPRLVAAIRRSPSYRGPLSFELSYRDVSAAGKTVGHWAADAFARCRQVLTLPRRP